MALLDPDKKKNGLLNPREKMGLDEGVSTRTSSNRVGKMVEGTPLGSPKTPVVEAAENITGTGDLGGAAKPKVKVKKKEIGVGAYQG